MFENLTSRLTTVFDKLRGRGALSEADVTESLREIRIALLEADVALPAVKHFIEDVRKVAIGQDILKSITPGQMIVKIVYDHLITLLGADIVPLNISAVPPIAYLMVGLQGSGKTTSSAKLARFIKDKLNKKPLLVSLDVYRPAAQKQLAILGEQLDITSLPIVEGESPLAITKRAFDMAKKQGIDVILLDTAGRLHIDDELMEEIQGIQAYAKPLETLLVADAMTGQDAVVMAEAFNKAVPITGVILTRLDGDARGGAALSIRHITGQPIKFMGVGEKLEQLEVFDPSRIADRILDRGDIVALVEKAASAMDEGEAAKMAEKMQKGIFTLNDLSKQLGQMLKMGGMGGLMNLMPGMGKLKDKINEAGVDDKAVKRQIAIISSMTKKERRDPKLLNGSRKKRIAKGSGVEVSEVNRLLKQFEQMADMMKKLKKMGGGKTMMRGGLKGLFGG
ncbi:MAG: signal recognition particle protein [Alphaproteobacteria bacterium]|nr:signal recognition particle protein [Alphaproteobacteria bacterium]